MRARGKMEPYDPGVFDDCDEGWNPVVWARPLCASFLLIFEGCLEATRTPRLWF